MRHNSTKLAGPHRATLACASQARVYDLDLYAIYMYGVRTFATLIAPENTPRFNTKTIHTQCVTATPRNENPSKPQRGPTLNPPRDTRDDGIMHLHAWSILFVN